MQRESWFYRSELGWGARPALHERPSSRNGNITFSLEDKDGKIGSEYRKGEWNFMIEGALVEPLEPT